jgi:hypothetical protein
MTNNDMRKVLMKHSFTDAKDICIDWLADFGKMTIDIKIDRQPIISPSLILTFLESLPRYDERFVKTKITDPIQITNEFAVTMSLITGTCFRVRVYRPGWPENAPLQLEFFELEKNDPLP